ncbi:MAG: transcriptional repressor [Proteobacteria bacterium]|nr:transcriptional repressor [Pseudomonadota bacterium]MBU1739856.1 transcriptional repressor [Pseudomonadota bacterium]
MIRFPFGNRNKTKKQNEPVDVVQHDAEREQFKAVLSAINATRIEDRLRVLDIFLSTEQHVTLASLAELMKKIDNDLYNMSFLRNTMNMFCQCGFARKQTFDDQDTTYEHHHLGTHHDHFICTACGKIQEFHNNTLERLQREIASDFGFHPLQHKMEIYGICTDCFAKRDVNLSLQMVAAGEKVRIVDIEGEGEMQGRLASMGLTPGTELEMINSNPAGPFIIAARDTRLALDPDMARSIIVVHICRHPVKM